MAEELEQVSPNEEQDINRTEERIKTLSSKVKLTAQERDEAKQLAEEAAAAKVAAERERDFFKDFSTVSSKYQGASEFQDKIWEKVNSGYTTEDATVAVLAAEGKFPAQETAPIVESAGGGSSSTVIPTSEKSPNEMTQEERRAALQEASDSGELAGIIRNFGRG